MKVLVLLCLAVFAADARLHKRNARSEYRLCVPKNLMSYCEQMTNQETKSSVKIVCLPARDRVECIDKIKNHTADFSVVDPEDMYIASKIPDNDFTVFEEIRTREEPEAEFRYEGVALIHKDQVIDGVKGIKGLKSCHTGVGRNVGYKIPLTKLKNMGIIGSLANPDLSPRENELDAFSNLFSKACIVGKWSSVPEIDANLKKKYANLCQLCEHPEKCDYPDNYSGYEGAIRCLVHNGGEIAWTKVIYVRKFFGLPVGTTAGHPTSENPEDYAYFCPDGTRVPVTGTPCRWAARPWQGYMTNAAIVKNVDELRRKIENLNTEGFKTHAEWLEKILEISDKNIAKENKVISPGDYLDKANYTDVVERDYGPPYKTLRICTHTDIETAKCKDLSRAAFTRNIRPRFDCVQEENCLKTIRDDGADVIALTAEKLPGAIEKYNLKAIVAEKYKEDKFAIAVVKKGSKFQSFADLKGAKSCHTDKAITSIYAPFYTLKGLDLLKKSEKCSAEQALANFFGGGCLPEADKFKLETDTLKKMCSLCDDKCTIGSNCPKAALKCLDKDGDVAFFDSSYIENMQESDRQKYELLCPEGSRAPLEDYKKCHLLPSRIPPVMIVSSNSKSTANLDEIRGGLVSAAETYSKRPDWFRMFGLYNDKHDVLFTDLATGLEAVSDDFTLAEIKKFVSVKEDFCN